ncbi:MAG TPA: alpha/beta fold hydrolase [Polyangiales bacterium]|nr:alpha/beta fold hydrolase [Polyangiales bacterium]
MNVTLLLGPWGQQPSGIREAASDHQRARERIQAALDHQLVHVWPFDDLARADLVLDARPVGSWTLHARDGRVTFKTGRPRKPTTVVETSAQTLLHILEGRRSGVSAWLEGDLRMRGNIALALKLEGLLRGPHRPVNFPKPGRVYAHGVDTFYLEAGHGDPVVLLHGLGSTNSGMLPTLDDLARDYRVIAPDIPGFGESGKPIRAYHAGFFARWLLALMRELNIERAHLVGNSMGGRIALEVALRAPERVDRLALLAPAVALRKLRQFVPLVRALRPELALLPLRTSRAAVIAMIRQFFADASRVDPSWLEAGADEFLRVFSTPRGRVAFFSALREIYLDAPWGARGFWARLETLSTPTLFLWGDRDRLVPAKFARHVSRAVPHAESIVLPDSGHVPHFEHPAETHRLIRDFLSRSQQVDRARPLQ